MNAPLSIARTVRGLSVGTKLAAAITLLIGLVALLIYIYFPGQLKRQATQALVDKAGAIAQMTAYSVSPALYFGDHVAAREALSGTAQNPDVVYVIVRSDSGRVFETYDRTSPRSIAAEGAPEFQNNAIHSITVTVTFNNQRIGTLELGLSLVELQLQLARTRTAVALVSVLIFLCGMAAVFLISTVFTRPLRRIVDVTVDIANGDLSRRAPVASEDEIGRLAVSFNHMVDSLETTRDQLEDLNKGLEERVRHRTQKLRQENLDRRRAEEALSTQRAFLRNIIDSDPTLIFTKDRAGKFTLVNMALAELYGTTVEDLIGRTDADFNSNKEEVEGFLRDDLEVMDTRKEKFIAEELVTSASGCSRWFQTTKRPLGESNGRVDQVLGVATDISARKEAEDALRKSEGQLRQALKMEAIGRLAGGVAHDFNNLLAIVMGHTELILSRLGEDDPLRTRVTEIDQAAQRAASLTRQLLAFSRRQVLEPRVLDLNSCVSNMDKMLRRLISENIEFAVAMAPDLNAVMADPGQIEQVIMNLTINARDAMPNGGRLTITTSNVEVSSSTVTQSPLGSGSYVLLTVSDTGCGMDEATLKQAFEPFFTTKEQGKGTGLGLSMVYGIVKQSGGYIDVDSTPGTGTTFRIYLPRVDQKVPASTPPSSVERVSIGTETVMVVEDEEGVRDLVRDVLTESGYTVLIASSGQEAVRMSSHFAGPIHLLVTDVMMPGMSGIELAHDLMTSRPDMRVIFMSGYAQEKITHGGVLDAGITHLQKPFRLDTLKQTVRQVLDSVDQPSEPAGHYS